MTIRSKRVYDPPSSDDGFRVLIDGLWPRGVSHERPAIDLWARELAPSEELRRWYGHEPGRFEEFSRRVTVVFAARDADHSNATVLVDVLRRELRGESR